MKLWSLSSTFQSLRSPTPEPRREPRPRRLVIDSIEKKAAKNERDPEHDANPRRKPGQIKAELQH
jgi:hypothetical protein